MNETDVAYITVVVSIIAVVASIISAIYARRSHVLEIKKYEKEIKEKKEKEIPHISIQDVKFIFFVTRANDLYIEEIKKAMRQKIGLKEQNSSDHNKNDTLGNSSLKSGMVVPAVYTAWNGIYKKIKQPRWGLNGTVVHLTSIKVTAELIIINESDVPSWVDNIRVGLRFQPPIPSPWSKIVKKWNGYVEWYAFAGKDIHYGLGVSTNFFDRLLGFPTSNNFSHQKLVELNITDFIASNKISFAEPIRLDPYSKLRWLVALEFTTEGIQGFFTEKYHPNQFLIKTQCENQTVSDSKSLQLEYQLSFIGTKGDPGIEEVPSVDWEADIPKNIKKYVAENIDEIMRAAQEKYESK